MRSWTERRYPQNRKKIPIYRDTHSYAHWNKYVLTQIRDIIFSQRNHNISKPTWSSTLTANLAPLPLTSEIYVFSLWIWRDLQLTLPTKYVRDDVGFLRRGLKSNETSALFLGTLFMALWVHHKISGHSEATMLWGSPGHMDRPCEGAPVNRLSWGCSL